MYVSVHPLSQVSFFLSTSPITSCMYVYNYYILSRTRNVTRTKKILFLLRTVIGTRTKNKNIFVKN